MGNHELTLKIQRNYFISIFLIALIIRLAIAFSSKENPVCDAIGYDNRAISLIEGKGFSQEGRPTAFKEPFYSFFLSGIYLAFGHSYLAVRIIQAIIGAFLCGFIFLIGKNVFNLKVGLLAGLIAGINPSFIMASKYLLTEILFALILVLVIFCSLKLSEVLSLKSSVILGLLAGIGALTRSTLAPFIILICAALFFLLKKRYPLKKILINILVIIICFLLPIIPWSIRNWSVFHEFIPISTNVGINLYSSYFPPQGKLFGFTAIDKNTEYAKSLKSEAAGSRFLLRKTLEKIKKVSAGYILRLEILKFMYFWTPFDWEIIGGGRYNFIYGTISLFFIVGIIILFSRMKDYILLYLPIFYYMIISLITYGSPRFRLVIEPYIILFSSAGLFYLCSKYPKKHMICLLCIWILANLAVFIYSEQIRLFINFI